MLKKSIDVRKITFAAVYVALITTLSFIPQVGYVRIGVIAFTTIPIFIAIATYHLGLLGVLSTSFTFGILAYIMSITLSPSPIADPVLMIVPRILLGLIIFGVYKLLGELSFWKLILLANLTVIFNTILFTVFLYIVSSYRGNFFSGSLYFWITLIYINFFAELGIAIGLGILLYPITRYLKDRNKNASIQKW